MSSQRKLIGLLPTTSLVTGNMVGSGVFLLPASLGVYGMLSLVGWGITTLGALFLALVFAFLSRQKILGQGGPHQFIRHSFGDKAGFYTAWGYWVLSWISNAALVVAIAGYLAELCGGLTQTQCLLIEVGVIAGITGVNLLGISSAGRFELVMTLLKLVPLLGLPLIGIFYVDWSQLTFANSEINTFANLKTVVFLTLWGFIGVETATVPSAEVRDPHKTIPRATVIGTLLAASVYILGTLVMLGVLSTDQLAQSNAPYAELAHTLFGGQWGHVIALAALLCCLGSLNGWTLVVSRIASGAAEEGLFPKIFQAKNKKGAPYISLLISSGLTIPLVVFSMQENLVEQFNVIIDFSITLILWVYLACILVYLKKSAEQSATMRTWLIGLGAFGFIGFSLAAAGLKMNALAGLLLLTGMPIHYWLNRQNQLRLAF